MDANKLKEILEQHKLYLANRTTGKRADLSFAQLMGANLIGSDLQYADLSYADLSYADLSYADLGYTDLTGSYLIGCDLSGANLSAADLSMAYLRYAELSEADLSRTKFMAVTQYPQLATKIAKQVAAQKGSLDMNLWHTCDTVHCLAGWAVTLHPQGKDLEAALGTSAAAALIFQVCCGEVPDFFSDKKTAIAWVKCRAEQRGQE